MIGQLRARLGLYLPQETPDNFGGAAITWTFSKAIWAAVIPKTITESQKNGRLTVTQSYNVIIRYVNDFPERGRLM